VVVTPAWDALARWKDAARATGRRRAAARKAGVGRGLDQHLDRLGRAAYENWGGGVNPCCNTAVAALLGTVALAGCSLRQRCLFICPRQKKNLYLLALSLLALCRKLLAHRHSHLFLYSQHCRRHGGMVCPLYTLSFSLLVAARNSTLFYASTAEERSSWNKQTGGGEQTCGLSSVFVRHVVKRGSIGGTRGVKARKLSARHRHIARQQYLRHGWGVGLLCVRQEGHESQPVQLTGRTTIT